MLDIKEKEFRDKGGVPINDVILQIRAEKMSKIEPNSQGAYNSKRAREEFKDEIEDDLDV